MTENGYETRKVDELIWREDLYPRIEPDSATIQEYAQDIEVYPPVEINQNNEIIDGYHRWTAHKKAGKEAIRCTVTHTEDSLEFFELALHRNNQHGLRQTDDDKKQSAIFLYRFGAGRDKDYIAKKLSVTRRSVNNYLEEVDKSLRAERSKRIKDMWLACYQKKEIAEDVGLSEAEVGRKITAICEKESLSDSQVVALNYAETKVNNNGEIEPAFNVPHYDIWSFSKKTNKTSHFGNTEQRIVDNLLYLYTKPFDIVVDPFAGGGSTIDVCKRRMRRYWVSDRLPIPERRDIRQHDIGDGPPPLPRMWSEVALAYLDPPYWKQAENEYSTDAEDLANMELEDFYASLVGFVKACASKMHSGSHIALILQPTMWRSPERKYIDHVFELVQRIGNKRVVYEQRVSCPYSTEQDTPQMVNWAKENKRLLVRNRELIIWRVR